MENMNWAAVIPARYIIAEDISSTQKLLLGLISSLSNLKGYCFASNEYLANLLKVNKVTISHSISDLEKKGYLGRIIYRNDKQQVEQRILTIILDKFNDIPISENSNPLPPKNDIPISENLKDNIKVNNKINNKNKELFFISNEWQELWNSWIEYKYLEHKDKFKSEKTEQLAINNLVKISNNNLHTAREIVNYSIVNKYKGLFQLKVNPQKETKLSQYTNWLHELNTKHEDSGTQVNTENKRISF